jgi:hypothetical protein
MPSFDQFIREILSRTNLNRNDVQSLLINIRRLLENENRQQVYKMLNFYGTWSVHAKVDRAPISSEILVDLSICIAKYGDDTFNPEFGKAVTEALGFWNLKKEFADFCHEFSFPIHFEEQDNWNSLYGLVLQSVSYAPLAFPKKMNQATKDKWEAAKVHAGAEVRVKQLQLVKNDGKICWSAVIDYVDEEKQVTITDERGLLFPQIRGQTP